MKIGPWEIILILIVVMMIFGAAKIPQIGKQLGRSMRDFKKYSSGADEPDSTGNAAKSTAGTAAEPPKLNPAAKAPEKPANNAFSKN